MGYPCKRYLNWRNETSMEKCHSDLQAIPQRPQQQELSAAPPQLSAAHPPVKAQQHAARGQCKGSRPLQKSSWWIYFEIQSFSMASAGSLMLRLRRSISASASLSEMPSTGRSQNKTELRNAMSGRSTCFSGIVPSS